MYINLCKNFRKAQHAKYITPAPVVPPYELQEMGQNVKSNTSTQL